MISLIWTFSVDIFSQRLIITFVCCLILFGWTGQQISGIGDCLDSARVNCISTDRVDFFKATHGLRVLVILLGVAGASSVAGVTRMSTLMFLEMNIWQEKESLECHLWWPKYETLSKTLKSFWENLTEPKWPLLTSDKTKLLVSTGIHFAKHWVGLAFSDKQLVWLSRTC